MCSFLGDVSSYFPPASLIKHKSRIIPFVYDTVSESNSGPRILYSGGEDVKYMKYSRKQGKLFTIVAARIEVGPSTMVASVLIEMGQGMWKRLPWDLGLGGSAPASGDHMEEEREPFHRINVDCLGNILLVLADQLAINQDLKDSILNMLFMEARKMGGHDNPKIIRWVQEYCSITLTNKECENLVSYVGLFLPFENEMETIEEDFHFVQQRCVLIPPSLQLMKEWAVQVKLMEKNVRIARGYITENPTRVTRHSKGFSHRFRKKRTKRIKKVSVSSFRKDGAFQRPDLCGASDSDHETARSREVSDENCWDRSTNRRSADSDESNEESKDSGVALFANPTNYTRIVHLSSHPLNSQLDHLPEEKIEDISQDGSIEG